MMSAPSDCTNGFLVCGQATAIENIERGSQLHLGLDVPPTRLQGRQEDGERRVHEGGDAKSGSMTNVSCGRPMAAARRRSPYRIFRAPLLRPAAVCGALARVADGVRSHLTRATLYERMAMSVQGD